MVGTCEKQTEKKEQEIALLKSQNELVEQQKKNQRNMLLGGLGFTSLVGIFLFVLYRNRQKTNNKLREIDTLKTNFFTKLLSTFLCTGCPKKSSNGTQGAR